MVRCSRFLPALLITFAYAWIIPVAILLRMHSAGWQWISNDFAFGFFMLLVFPFAVAVFSCAVDVNLLKRAITPPLTKITIPVAIFVIMLFMMPRMVYRDLRDVNCRNLAIHRVQQPYMYQDATKMKQLGQLHEQAFRSSDLQKASEAYRAKTCEGNNNDSTAMLVIFFICNFMNVGFGVTVFCYILLVSVEGQIGTTVCNHLVFVLAALAVWFPSRVYADWYINLGDLSWIPKYQAAAVISLLFIAGSVILALRMVEGTLYHRFALAAGGITAIGGAIAAIKYDLFKKIAATLEQYDPIFRVGFALIFVAFLYYTSSTIHQKTT
jgi:hypothetical protein